VFTLPGFDWKAEVEQASWVRKLEAAKYRVIREPIDLSAPPPDAPDTLPRQRPLR
jgi:hypothetical protein